MCPIQASSGTAAGNIPQIHHSLPLLSSGLHGIHQSQFTHSNQLACPEIEKDHHSSDHVIKLRFIVKAFFIFQLCLIIKQNSPLKFSLYILNSLF
jgi:hypothetical protein